MSKSPMMQAIAWEMVSIFGAHPDAARMAYRSNPSDDTAADHIGCCDVCHEPLADECGCQYEYRHEHDHGAER